ncbi:MAG: AbrB/MazE/SpoVT family DNA-binding domain-containing protein [Candidatus Thermoplasmatota archaeon]|nr:AbrB/MazE/SpoVT family DNA-binding domain-containing protein [Candidatus Thermoplasmatota archaeon]
MEAAIIRVSSKGQIVIPSSWRNRLGIDEGSELLAIGEGDTLMLKLIEKSSLKEEFLRTVGPIRKRIKNSKVKRKDVQEAIRKARKQ